MVKNKINFSFIQQTLTKPSVCANKTKLPIV